jgi:hypothetical protein
MSERAPRASLGSRAPVETGDGGGSTLTIASKMPSKLRLRIQEAYTYSENVLGGGTRDVTAYRDCGREIVLFGTAVPHDQQRSWTMSYGYALTPGVDAAMWEQWCAQNRGSPLLMNKMIFANPTIARAADEAKDNRKRTSGFEPIDPTRPVNMGQGFEIKPDEAMGRIDVVPADEVV